jgi:hypothetical protein
MPTLNARERPFVTEAEGPPIGAVEVVGQPLIGVAPAEEQIEVAARDYQRPARTDGCHEQVGRRKSQRQSLAGLLRLLVPFED